MNKHPQTYIAVVTTCKHGRTCLHERYAARFLATHDCLKCGGEGLIGGHSGSDGYTEPCSCRLLVCTDGSRRELTDDDLHRLISHIHTAHVCSPACARNVLINQIDYTTEVTDE